MEPWLVSWPIIKSFKGPFSGGGSFSSVSHQMVPVLARLHLNWRYILFCIQESVPHKPAASWGITINLPHKTLKNETGSETVPNLCWPSDHRILSWWKDVEQLPTVQHRFGCNWCLFFLHSQHFQKFFGFFPRKIMRYIKCFKLVPVCGNISRCSCQGSRDQT